MSLANTKKVADIITDAGGRIVGRTRLQKVAYLLTVTGMETGLVFNYKHYGPYCEELAAATRLANLLGRLQEVENPTSWGGSYSVFTTTQSPLDESSDRCRFARAAAEADAVELELAATAVFLSREGFSNPWEETARRKPEKVDNGRLERSKALLQHLSAVPTPIPLPSII